MTAFRARLPGVEYSTLIQPKLDGGPPSPPFSFCAQARRKPAGKLFCPRGTGVALRVLSPLQGVRAGA